MEVSLIHHFYAIDSTLRIYVDADKTTEQTKEMKNKYFTTLIIIFFLLGVLFYIICQYDPLYHFGTLIGGNILMAILSTGSFFIVTKQMNNSPAAFVRGVYTGTFLKLLVCMFALLVYVVVNRAALHKASLFALFGIYIVYTIAETLFLSKIVRKTK